MNARTDSHFPGPGTQEDRDLKARHAAMWASGDYPLLAREVVSGLGGHLVDALAPQSGERVLDIAAGTGNAAIPAAARGAAVTASDLTPELLVAGQAAADAAGVPVAWEVADAESLPYADNEFDVVMSCIGVMFAPHHELAAAELLRVCRPGGRIGLLAWTPAGFIGQLFAALRPYAAPPPPGASPAPLWGDPEYVARLLDARSQTPRVRDLRTTRHSVSVDRFTTPEEFTEYFRDHYGPTRAVFARVAADPGATASLGAALAALAQGNGAGVRPMEWEYLVVTATAS